MVPDIRKGRKESDEQKSDSVASKGNSGFTKLSDVDVDRHKKGGLNLPPSPRWVWGETKY